MKKNSKKLTPANHWITRQTFMLISKNQSISGTGCAMAAIADYLDEFQKLNPDLKFPVLDTE